MSSDYDPGSWCAPTAPTCGACPVCVESGLWDLLCPEGCIYPQPPADGYEEGAIVTCEACGRRASVHEKGFDREDRWPEVKRYRVHAETERRAEPTRDTVACPWCRQFVPVVTHDCPAPDDARNDQP